MISIVLPFFRKLADFRRVLPLNRPYFARPWVEVVVVMDENESESGVLDLIRQYPDIRWQVRVNDQPHGWQPPCKAINVGVRHASHEVVLVCSPESMFVTDVPAQALGTVRAVPRGVALGRVGFGQYAQLHQLGASAAFDAVAPDARDPFKLYGSIALARQELELIGGYDESFRGWGADDDNVRVRLAMNGARLLGCPQMKLLHLADEPRRPSPAFNAASDLRKCSPATARANLGVAWGRAFSRLAWPIGSQPGGRPEVAATVPVPVVINPAFPVPSRQRCPVCGRFTQLQQALSFCLRCVPQPHDQVSDAPRLLCVMQVRNEARVLPGCFEHLRGYVDGFIVLDDGSTDGTREIVSREPALLELLDNPPAQPHVWNERDNKRRLLQAARRHGAQWVLVCDADERYEMMFVKGLRPLGKALDALGFQMLTLARRELWDRPDQYRIDGRWLSKNDVRLLKVPEVIAFERTAQLHGSWVPDALLEASRQARRHAVLNYHMYHLKMIHEADRIRRRDLYKSLDPDGRFQAEGYDYLTEAGDELELAPITEDRWYDRRTLPADLQAMLERSTPVGSPTLRATAGRSLFDDPLDHALGDEADHAEGQRQKQHEGAELAGFGLPRQLADDEQHVEDEGADAEGQAEPGDLLLVEAEHQAPPSGGRRSGRLSASTSAR